MGQRSRASGAPPLPTDTARSATRPPRRRAPRGHRARILRDVEHAATARQVAWSEGSQPETTERLTSELDELYGEVRDTRRGVVPDVRPGNWTGGKRGRS